jgi:hypothetical protein
LYTTSLSIDHSINASVNPLSQIDTKSLQLGDRVLIGGTKYGTLKYIGSIHVSDGIWCGMKLDEPVGKNNGKLDNVRYFKCQHRFGLFAPIHRVERVASHILQPRLSILSTASFNQSNDSNSDDLDISDLSGSTTGNSDMKSSLRHDLTRPIFNRQLPIDDEQIPVDTIEIIKDKDPFREPNQHDNAHVEQLKEQLNEMTMKWRSVNEQYEKKTVQYNQMQQRIDDLQFQLDEYRSHETNREQIPDGYCLISQHERATFDDVHRQISSMNTMNTRLVDENQQLKHEIEQQTTNNDQRHHNIVNQMAKLEQELVEHRTYDDTYRYTSLIVVSFKAIFDS